MIFNTLSTTNNNNFIEFKKNNINSGYINFDVLYCKNFHTDNMNFSTLTFSIFSSEKDVGFKLLTCSTFNYTETIETLNFNGGFFSLSTFNNSNFNNSLIRTLSATHASINLINSTINNLTTCENNLSTLLETTSNTISIPLSDLNSMYFVAADYSSTDSYAANFSFWVCCRSLSTLQLSGPSFWPDNNENWYIFNISISNNILKISSELHWYNWGEQWDLRNFHFTVKKHKITSSLPDFQYSTKRNIFLYVSNQDGECSPTTRNVLTNVWFYYSWNGTDWNKEECALNDHSVFLQTTNDSIYIKTNEKDRGYYRAFGYYKASGDNDEEYHSLGGTSGSNLILINKDQIVEIPTTYNNVFIQVYGS